MTPESCKLRYSTAFSPGILSLLHIWQSQHECSAASASFGHFSLYPALHGRFLRTYFCGFDTRSNSTLESGRVFPSLSFPRLIGQLHRVSLYYYRFEFRNLC